MSDKTEEFPEIPERLPARLTTALAARILGFQPHDIRLLVAARILKPLGDPPPQGVRFFFAADILEVAANRSQLSRATNIVYQHWARKNRDGPGAGVIPKPVSSDDLRN